MSEFNPKEYFESQVTPEALAYMKFDTAYQKFVSQFAAYNNEQYEKSHAGKDVGDFWDTPSQMQDRVDAGFGSVCFREDPMIPITGRQGQTFDIELTKFGEIVFEPDILHRSDRGVYVFTGYWSDSSKGAHKPDFADQLSFYIAPESKPFMVRFDDYIELLASFSQEDRAELRKKIPDELDFMFAIMEEKGQRPYELQPQEVSRLIDVVTETNLDLLATTQSTYNEAEL